MKMDALRAEYYEVVVEEESAAANAMLQLVSRLGINLLAYKSVCLGQKRTRFTIFALRSKEMSAAIKADGLELSGPSPAVVVHGDDVPGALADIFGRLAKAGIAVRESSGIAGINRGYGVVLYMSCEDCERALDVLRDSRERGAP